MEYYSAIKRNAFESVLMRWMNLEHTEWSKSEKETQKSYMNAYIWNLERWYWHSYTHSCKGDTDIKNRLLDTVGGEGGMIWQNSTETYILPNSQWKFDVWCKEPKLVLCDNLGGWSREGGGRGAQEGRVTHMPMANSCWCMAEAITIL